MQTEYLVLDDRCKRQIVEQINEHLPDIFVAIFSLTLIVETVDLCDALRLMVAPCEGDALLVPNFQREKQ